MGIRKISAILLSAVLFTTAVPAVSANAENTESKLIALTFDDGPNATTTNEVLDILEEYDAKASFFLIGQNINDESAVAVKRAYDMGMEIDNHSRNHLNMSKLSPEEIKAEVDYVDEKVKEIIGEGTKFFRPPFIDVSQVMYDNIDLPFICGIETRDYMPDVNAQQRADYILNGAKDGVIVLMHDAAGNSQTVEALKIAMPILKEQGYEFVTLTELFERQGETPRDNILYSRVAKYPCSDYTLNSDITSSEKDKIPLDKALLKQLGEDYAIEMEYVSDSGYPPVISLQRWSTQPSIWYAVQPSYSNGEKAVFLADDVLSAMKEIECDYDSLDGLTVSAYGGTIALSNAKLLVRGESTDQPSSSLSGDVNGDNKIDLSDVIMLNKWLTKKGDITVPENADINSDGKVSVIDLMILKNTII